MASIKGTKKNNTLTGTIVADNIFGFAGNDVLTGDAGNDKLYGGTGNDRLYGGIGNDRLEGGAGNDRLFGGKGTDTAAFSQASSNYTVTKSGTNLIVTGPDGQDTIAADVEILKFANTSIVIKAAVPVAGNDAAAGNEDTAIHTGNVLANDTTSINTLTGASITAFSQGAHGSVANNGDGTFTYTPVANYNGADSFTYTIDNGIGGKSTATVNVAVAPTNDAPVAVGDNGTASHGVPASSNVNLLTNDTDIDGNTLSVSQVNGSAANVGHAVATAQGGTVTVNADGSYTYNSAGVAAFDALPVGQNGFDSFTYQASDGHGGTSTATVNLTVAGVAKNITLTQFTDVAPSTTGSAGNDTYFGSVNTNSPTLTTFNTGDALNALGGSLDLLHLELSGTSSQPIVGTQLSNLEIVEVRNTAVSGAPVVTFNAAQWAGVGKIVSENSFAGSSTVFTGLGGLVTAELSNFNEGNLQIGYSGALLTGGADTQDLILTNNVGGLFTVGDGGAHTAETLHITSQTAAPTVTANTVVINAANNHTAITVDGGQRLALNVGALSTLTTINASGMTGGGVDLTGLGAPGPAISVIGSSFNDQLDYGPNALDSDTVAGGAGTDLLILGNGFGTGSFANLSSIEQLGASLSSTLTVTLDAAAQTAGINAIKAFDSSTVHVTVAAGFTGPLTVDLDATAPHHTTPSNNSGPFDSVDGSLMAAKLTVTALAGNLDATDQLTAGAGVGVKDELILTADGFTADLSGVSGFEKITVLAGANALNGAAINVVLGSVVTNGNTLVVDASALSNVSATFAFDGSAEIVPAGPDAVGKFDVTGGAGDDIITGGAGDDTLTGGAGGDQLTAGLGADKLYGGANDDTFVLAANLTSADTIDGGAGTGDKLQANAGLIDAAFTKVTNVEILQLLGAAATTTLDTLAYHGGAGIKQVLDTGNSDIINFGQHYAGAISVGISAGADIVTVDAFSTATLTVTAKAGDVTAADHLTANAGGADTLILTADDNAFGANLNNVIGFDKITVLAGALGTEDATIFVGTDSVVTNGGTLIVDASALTNTGAIFLFDGSAETTPPPPPPLGTQEAVGIFNVTGGSGDDLIIGGDGADMLSGGAGADTLIGGKGADSLTGGIGVDTLFGGDGVDTLNGGDGADTINSGLGNDIVFGGAGDDQIFVVDALNNGADTISLGTGGFDTVLFNLVGQTATGVSTVTDFNAVNEDLISVSAAPWAGPSIVIQSAAAGAVDARLVILDNTPFASLSDAANAADNLNAGTAGNAYLFAWNDGTNTHISYAVTDIGDAVQDNFTDLVKLENVSLANLNRGDFNFI